MKTAVFNKRKLKVLDITREYHLIDIIKHKKKLFANEFYPTKERFDVEFKVTKLVYPMIHPEFEIVERRIKRFNEKNKIDIKCVSYEEFNVGEETFEIIFLDRKVLSLPEKVQRDVVELLTHTVRRESVIMIPTWNEKWQMSEVIYKYLTDEVNNIPIDYQISQFNRFFKLAENYFEIAKDGRDNHVFEYYLLFPREWIVEMND